MWCKRISRGGSVGDSKRDPTPLNNHGCDWEGEGAVGISEGAGSAVWEGGCDQGDLVVFGGGRVRSVKPSFRCGERLGGLDFGHRIADGHHLCSGEGALLLITVLGCNSRGGLSVGLWGFGALGIRIARDERRWVRVFVVTNVLASHESGNLSA